MIRRIFLAAFAAATLVACGDDATVTPGIEAKLEVVSEPTPNDCAEGVAVGEEGQSFCTGAGERIDLINALVVPFPVRVVECPSVNAALKTLGDWLLPAAQAHGGHVDPPAGVVDLAEPAGTTWHMGTLPLPPGRYCGVELALEHLPAGTLPAETVPDADDVFLYARPCHFPNPAPPPPEHNHSCYTVAVHGDAPTLRLDFAEPVQLDASHRELRLTLALHYDGWYDGIDFAVLETDAEEQAQLVENVLASLTLTAELGE